MHGKGAWEAGQRLSTPPHPRDREQGRREGCWEQLAACSQPGRVLTSWVDRFLCCEDAPCTVQAPSRSWGRGANSRLSQAGTTQHSRDTEACIPSVQHMGQRGAGPSTGRPVGTGTETQPATNGLRAWLYMEAEKPPPTPGINHLGCGIRLRE